MSHSLVYITCDDMPEAQRIAAALIEERLAACANMIEGMTSCYRWQGEIRSDREVVLIAKTKTALVPDLTDRVVALHSYDLPCVVAVAIDGGNPQFLEWISEETK
ncbi:MAG: divalent-cation tolerance protein CutA [Alphaproteobacteria bacterium]|nr:divalent-cation tolerance protein CutA [Alphaproteobacteria bacterium]MCZ6764377.1 divalent-cation tolerance protein CutA [Alphaproteobacteria bacterium]